KENGTGTRRGTGTERVPRVEGGAEGENPVVEVEEEEEKEAAGKALVRIPLKRFRALTRQRVRFLVARAATRIPVALRAHARRPATCWCAVRGRNSDNEGDVYAEVHNIVLYPDKHSWCKTTPIKQVVTWPQCSSQELDNNVCVGACFSYMVPHSEPSAPGDLIRPYCDSCQPLDSVWHTVTLDCKDEQNNPVTMQKKVQIITNCSCSSCMETSKIKPDYNTLLQSLTEENLDKNVNVAHETPDLLLDPNLNASKNTTREFNGTQINERFHQLVKKLKESQKLDDSHMKELFSKYEEEVDLEKLKETIKKYTQENKEGQHEHHRQHQHEHQHQHQQQQQQHLHHGPHHSLVLDSDVKEKIDVEPHYLHPAVAGQEISYHDNILVGKEKKKNF
ncbi:Neuroblastoma suppressor of tumorigenicity 1, partial [Trachymyrmex zeteki]